MNISVCLATFNGKNYIEKQLDSILRQLNDFDEVIIVDDCSTDNTLLLIKNFNDSRIKVFQNDKNLGHVQSFSLALSLSKNEIIFLSDQDDIWKPNRVNLMVEKIIESNSLLLSSNFDLLFDNTIIDYSKKNELKFIDSTRYLVNIFGIFMGKRNYFGCAMAFQRQLLKLILPIPKYVEAHDLWIAFAANILKSNLHIEDITLTRRIHNNNASNLNRKFLSKIFGRIIFLRSILHLIYRKIRILKFLN